MHVWCILLFKCAACQTGLSHLWFPLRFSEIVLLTSCGFFFAISGRCITLWYIYQKAICGVILMILSGVIQSYHEACAHQMRSNHCWSGRQKLSTHAHLEHPDFSSGLELLLRRCQPAHSNSIRGLQNPHYLFLYLSSALDKHQSPLDSIKLRALTKVNKKQRKRSDWWNERTEFKSGQLSN